MKNRGILKKGLAVFSAVVTAAASLAFQPSVLSEIHAADQQVTGKWDDYDYELWNEKGNGLVNMKRGESGAAFSCSWANISNCIFDVGKKLGSTKYYTDYENIIIEYKTVFSVNGDAYTGVYGWTEDSTVEYFVIEAWGEWRPPGTFNAVTTVTSDGKTYDVYSVSRVNMPSIHGTETYSQYWSVNQKNPLKYNSGTGYSGVLSGTVNVKNHFNAWNEAGLKTGKMYSIAYYVNGYNSSGSADVSTNNLIFGSYTPQEKEEESTDKFVSASATLSSGVIMNFKVEIPDYYSGKMNDSYVKFSGDSIDKKIAFKTVSPSIKSGNAYYVFSIPVRPDCMTENITAQIVYGDGKTGESITYSVKQYLEELASGENGADYTGIVNAMLSFGARAQEYTGHRLSDLADITDDGERIQGSESASIPYRYTPFAETKGDGISVISAGLDLGSKTSMYVKFRLDNPDGYYTVNCMRGDTYQASCYADEQLTGNILTVRLNNISPQYLDEIYEITVNYGDNSEAYVRYSPFSYFKQVLENQDSPENLRNLVLAMYDYCTEAQNLTK